MAQDTDTYGVEPGTLRTFKLSAGAAGESKSEYIRGAVYLRQAVERYWGMSGDDLARAIEGGAKLVAKGQKAVPVFGWPVVVNIPDNPENK